MCESGREGGRESERKRVREREEKERGITKYTPRASTF